MGVRSSRDNRVQFESAAALLPDLSFRQGQLAALARSPNVGARIRHLCYIARTLARDLSTWTSSSEAFLANPSEADKTLPAAVLAPPMA